MTSRIEHLSQRSRRVIGIVALLGLPTMYAWSAFWLSTSVPTVIWGPISFLLIGLTVAGGLVLYRFVRDRADLGSATLDERQRQLRDHAYVVSYGILSATVVAVIGVVAVVVLGFGQAITLDGAAVSAMAIVIGTLIPLLPIACMAWVEPDVLGED
jgi:hypothetical protein